MDPRVTAAIDIMAQATNSRISVASMSRRLNLSSGRFRELFKEETGQSPKRYLKKLRMERAEELLRSTFLSIKEITFLIGMNDVSHFVRDFKKEFGLKPSQLRIKDRLSEEIRPIRGANPLTDRRLRH
jgi:transcriptional regulator GlxA family with amidase domain